MVIVPWLTEGMFPSSRAAEEGRLDEERRLFYVAVTRAKDRLFLFAPQTRRMTDGGMFPVEPSLFVKEIPSNLLVVRRITDCPGGYGGGGGYGGYGGRWPGGGYGGRGGYGRPKTVTSTTWRR